MTINRAILTPLFLLALVAHAHDEQQQQQGRDTIPGFEDPKLLADVMSGKIVFEDKVSTKTEIRTVGRAFFNKVSPEAYTALATSYAKYPSMFSEVKEGTTLSVSADALQHDYRLHLVVKVGIFVQDAYPEGRHTIVPGPDATSETKLLNVITNYQDQLKFTRQTTRLIPYQGGILVEDDIHFALHNDSTSAGIMKKKLKEFFTKYLTVMRKELQGNY